MKPAYGTVAVAAAVAAAAGHPSETAAGSGRPVDLVARSGQAGPSVETWLQCLLLLPVVAVAVPVAEDWLS